MTRKSDGPDYDFGPYEDEYRGFEIRDDDSGRGPLILALAFGVLLIFAGVVWNTYRQGVRPVEGGLPVIASDDAPYKRAPDDRGGMQVAGQDNGFYGQMDGLGDPATAQKAAARNPAEIRRNTPVLSGAAPDLPDVEGVSRTEETLRSPALEGLDSRQAKTGDVDPVQIASLQPVGIPSKQEIAPVIDVLPPAREPVVSRFAASGGFQVQLMALRSEAAAQTEWQQAKNKSPDLFHGAKLDIQRADLGAKGVFYRLRLGSFETRAGANRFCDDVKATGRDCIVVAKAVG